MWHSSASALAPCLVLWLAVFSNWCLGHNWAKCSTNMTTLNSKMLTQGHYVPINFSWTGNEWCPPYIVTLQAPEVHIDTFPVSAPRTSRLFHGLLLPLRAHMHFIRSSV